MIVITDVNKLFSAAYTPEGAEAKIFSSKSSIQFLAPDYLLDEFKNHVAEIADATGLSKKRVKRAFLSIVAKIRVVEIARVPKEHIIQAVEIVRDIDPYDAPYVHYIYLKDTKYGLVIRSSSLDWRRRVMISALPHLNSRNICTKGKMRFHL